MSDIKKWVGENGQQGVKNKSSVRQFDAGSRRANDASRIDYSGPVPRVTTKSDKEEEGVRPIPRGFWAARPDAKEGVLFGVTTVAEVTALRVLKDNCKTVNGGYVVGPLKTTFGKRPLSPENYHDIAFVDANGKAWLNGLPFPSEVAQRKLPGGKNLLFLRGTTAADGKFTYESKSFTYIRPFLSVTNRWVGLGTITSVVNGVSTTVDTASYATTFFSSADATPLADIAPGYEWQIEHVAAANEPNALRLKLWLKGAKSSYSGSDTGNNMAPISTHQIVYQSVDGSAVYTHTGGAWSTGYMGAAKTVTPTSTSALTYPDESNLQLPILANIGTWSYSHDTLGTLIPGGFCVGYQPTDWYDKRTSWLTNQWAEQLVADEHINDPGLGSFNVDISTLSAVAHAAPATTQSFLYAPLSVSFVGTATGKQGRYDNKTLSIQWSLAEAPYSGAAVTSGVHASFSVSPGLPAGNQHFGGNSLAGDYGDYYHYTVPSAYDESPSPVSWLVGYSAPQNSRKRVFSGVGSLEGYRAELSYTLNSSLGQLLSAKVKNSKRYSYISGTKYVYPDAIDYTSAVPDGPYGQNFEFTGPPYTFFPKTAYKTWNFGGVTCPGSSANQISAYDDYLRSKEDWLADVAKRKMYHYGWEYGAWGSVSSAHSTTVNINHKTRYELTLREFLYLSPSLKITLDVNLVRDFGVGADYDNRVQGSTADTYLIELVTTYLGAEIDRRVIYSGAVPAALLDFSNDYYGTEDYAGALGLPVAHPVPTIRNGVGGIFPAYSQQECCPFVAYTTAAEVLGGATPQLYIDMPIRLINPRNFAEVSSAETEYQFPPLQLLNALNWMCANYTADDDDSAKVFQYLGKLHEALGTAIKLRLYHTSVTGTVKDSLPPDLQAKYGISTVHFGRI